MPRKSIDVTDTELSILTILWERGAATIRKISDELYSEESTAAEYATVQKLLERLQAKGCVSRDSRSFAHVFRAKIKRSSLMPPKILICATFDSRGCERSNLSSASSSAVRSIGSRWRTADST